MKKFLKWFGIIAGSLVGLLVVAMLVLYGMGQARLNKKYDVPVQMVAIPIDAESIAEGKRIFQYRGCEACHGENLQGLVYLDNPAIGQVITPNLTSGAGGIGDQLTDEDLIRAIRHGIRSDGTPLLFMPSTEFYFLSDKDLGNVLAYIKSMPPVDNEVPPSKLSTTGFIVMNIARTISFLPAELIPHDQTPPPAPNLTSGAGSRLPGWGEDGFIKIIRTGENHGRKINPSYMPWKSYRHMSDDELKAVYAFLMSLPPKAFGNR